MRINDKILSIVSELKNKGLLDKEIRTLVFHTLGGGEYARYMVEMIWSPAIRQVKQGI